MNDKTDPIEPAAPLSAAPHPADGARVEPTVQPPIAAAAATPVVTVLPRVEKIDGGRLMHIPAEAGYGGSVFPMEGQAGGTARRRQLAQPIGD